MVEPLQQNTILWKLRLGSTHNKRTTLLFEVQPHWLKALSYIKEVLEDIFTPLLKHFLTETNKMVCMIKPNSSSILRTLEILPPTLHIWSSLITKRLQPSFLAYMTYVYIVLLSHHFCYRVVHEKEFSQCALFISSLSINPSAHNHLATLFKKQDISAQRGPSLRL